MKDLITQPPIMSISEMRKIANEAVKGCLDGKSDTNIEQFITELDFLAQLFLESVVASKEAAYKQEN